MQYNHHHDTAVVGKGAKLVEVDASKDPRVQGRNYVRLDKGMGWLPVEHTPSANGMPTSAMFSSGMTPLFFFSNFFFDYLHFGTCPGRPGNGGEYRMSYHVLPPPFAQLVESPVSFAGAAMQVFF